MNEEQKKEFLPEAESDSSGAQGGCMPELGTIEPDQDSLLRSLEADRIGAGDDAAPQENSEDELPPVISDMNDESAESAQEAEDVSSPLNASNLPPIDMGPKAASLAEAAAGSDAFAVTMPQESRLKKAWREKRLFIILTSIFLLLAVAAIAVISYVYFVIHPYETYDKILPNVYCAGINLGGMTKEEAQNAIEEALRYPSYSVRLVLPDCEYTFQPQQEGITLNGADVAQQAYNYGRSDPSAYGIYRAYHAAKKKELRLSAEFDLVYSAEDIQALADQVYQETAIAPTLCTASCDTEEHTVTLTLGQPGRKIEPQVICDAVNAAFDQMNFSDITMEYDKVEIDLAAAKLVCNDAAVDFKVLPVDPVVTANQEEHTIDLTMGTQGWELNRMELYDLAVDAVNREDYSSVTLAMTAIEPVDVDITGAYSELACDPVEPYYYAGTVYESTYGYTLDWEAAINQILESTYGAQLSIPMTPIAPKLTAEEVRAVLFRDRLSSFSTPHTANSNRTHNLSLACEAINGTVINAGETFSFNNVVGERTAAKGYREATVYVGTESKDELGGGICQVASTIYDAALYAEMEITSRACHTFFVTYVEGGLDATVYWGSLDFCFRNNTDYPIRVNASVSGGYVTISIDGTKTNDHVVKLSSTRLSTVPYETVIKYDPSMPAGYEKETTYPYTGYTYEAYQYIYDSKGNLLDTIYLGKSTYQKRDRVITRGGSE